MKKVVCFAALILVSVLLAATSQAQAFLTNGLQADYQFNGNVTDASGHGNNGTNNGGQFTFDRFGINGGAIYFTNANVTTGFLPPIGGAARTISGWFNAPTNTTVMTLFVYGDAAFAGGKLEGNVSSSGHFAVETSSGTILTTNVCNDSRWHQFIIIVPAVTTTTNLLVYVDGKLQVTVIGSPGLVNTRSTHPLSFGAFYDGTRHFTGALDDVRIYNRELSAAEIQQLYSYELSTPEISPYPATATAVLAGSSIVGTTNLIGGYGYTNPPLVKIIGGGGTGAQAVAVISNSAVASITILNAGIGYTNVPVLAIEPPIIFRPLLKLTPTTVLAFSNLIPGTSYQLQHAVAWYWTNESASFTATNTVFWQAVGGATNLADYRLATNPPPAQAFATPQVVNGFVVGANVTAGGSGYFSAPAVSIVGGSGSNAMAVAQISTNGAVTNVMITAPGIGYTNPPNVEIAPPPTTAISPALLPVMRLDASLLAPYDNYQIQFTPALDAPWQNWNGGAFIPTATTNSQYLYVTNGIDFFRVEGVP